MFLTYLLLHSNTLNPLLTLEYQEKQLMQPYFLATIINLSIVIIIWKLEQRYVVIIHMASDKGLTDN